MVIRYHNSVEDVVAFQRFHLSHSPTARRARFTGMFLVTASVIAVSLFITPTDEISRPVIVGVAVVLAALLSAVFSYTLPASMDRQARRMYEEGVNRGILGQHEIKIDDDGLVERTEVNETRQSWLGVERIAETDDHAFIYISSMSAHVIPKESNTVGDVDVFLAHARQLWQAKNPDAAHRQDT